MNNNNNNAKESNYERQTVKHALINPYQETEIQIPATGWIFEVKKSRITKGIHPSVEIDPNQALPGYISKYEIHFYDFNNERIFKVRLYFDVLIENGLVQVFDDVSANLTSGSELTRILVNLGIPVGNLDEINLDDLMGINTYCYLEIDNNTGFHIVRHVLKR